MLTIQRKTADFFTFTKETLNGKLHFLCSVCISLKNIHCVKSVQIRSFFSGPNTGKCGPEKLRIRKLFMHCI